MNPVHSPAVYESIAEDDFELLHGDDPANFEDYDEYLAYKEAAAAQRQTEAAKRTANVVEGTARSGEFIVDCAILFLLIWVLAEGSEVVSRKLSLGY